MNAYGTPSVTKHNIFTSAGTFATDWVHAYQSGSVITDGFTVITVDTPVGYGASLAVSITGGATDLLHLGSVKTTWTTTAAVPLVVLSKGQSSNNG